MSHTVRLRVRCSGLDYWDTCGSFPSFEEAEDFVWDAMRYELRHIRKTNLEFTLDQDAYRVSGPDGNELQWYIEKF